MMKATEAFKKFTTEEKSRFDDLISFATSINLSYIQSSNNHLRYSTTLDQGQLWKAEEFFRIWKSRDIPSKNHYRITYYLTVKKESNHLKVITDVAYITEVLEPAFLAIRGEIELLREQATQILNQKGNQIPFTPLIVPDIAHHFVEYVDTEPYGGAENYMKIISKLL